MRDILARVRHAWQIYAAVGLATAPMIVVAVTSGVRGTKDVALYAGVGEELIAFSVDVDRGTLTRQSSVTLPGFVQEAWASPTTPYLYVGWSNGGASYTGSGVAAANDRHGVTAFRIDAQGALTPEGTPASLRSRPIHVSGDMDGSHLLVAYNDPSGISVHNINSNGTLGDEVRQDDGLDVGIYGHQVRALPDNSGVILVTRGNQATATTREDPGALKVFRYAGGKLVNRASIAPGQGLGFRSRHLDFHPARPWMFLTIESQNRLDVFSIAGGSVGAQPMFGKSTLASGGGETDGQTTSSVHVHPNGRFVYVGNRSTAAEAGANNIAVFRVNQNTGEPSLVENVDTHGLTPRTFSIDPAGRLLVVGNQTTREAVPANLALFRIADDGRLTFLRRYDVSAGSKPLWWMGLVALR